MADDTTLDRVFIVENDKRILTVIQDPADENPVVIQDRQNLQNDFTILQDVDPQSGQLTVVDKKAILFRSYDFPDIETINYIDQNKTRTLIDAGPVFEGPIGPEGPTGPDLYATWLKHGYTGSFEDFLKLFQGEQGVPGPAGPPIYYTFIQNQAASQWIIPHTLNKIPQVILIDSTGEAFEADISYPEPKSLVLVTLIAPQPGTAILQ